MACSIIRNQETNEIERVLAPNGQDSILYKSLVDFIKDKEAALRLWAQTYTPTFKRWFGDWEKEAAALPKYPYGVTTEFDLNLIKRPNGRIGEQGATAEGIRDLLKHIGVDLPENVDTSSIRAMADYLRNNTEERDKVEAFTQNNPIQISQLPDDSFDLKDGNHRATILYHSGVEDVPAVIKDNTNKPVTTTTTPAAGEFSFSGESPKDSGVSKVVDANGEPLVVYHGSPVEGIEIFNRKESEEGFITGIFFTDNKQYTSEVKEGLTNIYPTYLNIRNPENRVGQGDIDHKVATWGFEKGFDGVIGEDYGQVEGSTYVVYDPAQIKSVDNSGKFSIDNNNIYQQVANNLESSPADEITIQKIRKLLAAIGFTDDMIQSVENIEVGGVPITANGIADIANRIIQVAHGKENIALPEEAMHFIVELLEQTRPDLFKALMSSVTSFKIYKDIIKDPEYTNAYRTSSGAIDINKLKKEAVAKVLVEFVVKENDPREYEEDEVRTMRNIWIRILDFLRDLFRNKKNPFKTVADAIKEEQFGMFGNVGMLPKGGSSFFSLKLSERDKKYEKSGKMLGAVRNKVSTYKITKKDDQYLKDGQPHSNRVSDEVDKYYAKKFGAEKNFPEHLKELYEISREDGNLIHSVIETIINMYVDKDTGLLRDKPLGVPDYIRTDEKTAKVYKALQKNIVERITAFPEGTRFSAEQIVYNENTDKAGTIDLLVIDPEGETSVFDWKSLMFEDYTKLYGLKDYKREAFDVQMKEYRDILKSYGINNFGYMRMIPISKVYIQDEKTDEWKLVKIGIGKATPTTLEDENLKQFISTVENTGNKRLDKFIASLREQIEQIKIKFKNTDYSKMQDSISQLHNIIYSMQIAENNTLALESLNSYLATQIAEVSKALEGIDAIDKKDNKQVNNVLREIRFVHNSLDYMKQADVLFKLVEAYEGDPLTFAQYDPEEIDELKDLISEAEDKVSEIEQAEMELMEALASSKKILGLLDPERVMNLWQRYARSTSQGGTAAIQLLYKITDNAFQKSTFELDERHKSITDLKFRVAQKAKEKGVTVEQYMEKLFGKNKDGKFNGHFISEVDSEFYKERDLVMQGKNKSERKKWFLENYRMEEYLEWYKERLKEVIDETEENTYATNEKLDKLRKEFKIKNFKQQFDVVHHAETAISSKNTMLWNNFVDYAKWPSKEYLEIAKDPVLLEAFDYFRSINKELKEQSLLEDQNSFTFIPNIRRGFAESITLGDKNLKRLIPFNGFLNDIRANDEGMYFGKVDPRTGQKVDELHVRFTGDNFNRDYKEKSKDLFASYYLMSQELVQYKYLSEIDEVAQSLLHIEKSKGSIDKDGQLTKDNADNLQVLQQQVKGLIYRQSLQTGEGVSFSYNYNKFVGVWNKGFMGKIKKLKEIKNGEVKISGTKFIMKLNNYNAIRALSGNLTSTFSGIFGGTASTYMLGTRYFYHSDITDAMMRMQSNSWYATEDMKKRAALVDYFLPLIEEKANRKATQLSVARASEFLSGEWMMDLQRKGDEMIQLNIFLATIENFTIQDGKLVSIREIIEKKNGYNKRFDTGVTQAQRTALEKKVKAEVIEYRKTHSIANQAKYETRKVKGKDETFITLPGIERGGEETQDLRRLVQAITKDAIGNVSDTDVSTYKFNLIMRLFMSFKNWIPRTADVRFGELRYEVGKDAWEYGRYRMWGKAIGGNILLSIAKLTPLLGKGISSFEGKDYLIKRAKEVYAEKVQMMRERGLYSEETFIAEDVFIQSFIEGVNATFAEMRNAMMLFALLATPLLMAGPDDDDETKNFKRKTARAVDKLADEISFFYNPNSFLDIMGTKPLPVLSLLSDAQRTTSEIMKEVFGTIFKNDEWVDSAKPAKYIFRMFPISKEIIGYIPIIDPELAKEMGIQITNRSRNQ